MPYIGTPTSPVQKLPERGLRKMASCIPWCCTCSAGGTLGDRHADAVVAHRRIACGTRTRPRTALSLSRRPDCSYSLGEVTVIAEQRLFKPIFHDETDNRGLDVNMSLALHLTRKLFATHAPTQLLSL